MTKLYERLKNTLPYKKLAYLFSGTLLSIGFFSFFLSTAQAFEFKKTKVLPPFPANAVWLNTQSTPSLNNKVTLIDIWTFECWNCYRSFPWLTELEEEYKDKGMSVIGVHSPEFDHEKRISSIQAKADEFGLHHPILIDNDFSYWRALDNKYWPAYYLVDKKGQIRYRFIGETHANSRQARRIEEAINKLLAE